METPLCEHMIVSCIDYRIQKHVTNYGREHLGGTYDYLCHAGATKDLNRTLEQIDMAVELHGVRHVTLIHHENCGAYGELGSLDRHVADLARAASAVRKLHPNVSVKAFYLRLDGRMTPLSV